MTLAVIVAICALLGLPAGIPKESRSLLPQAHEAQPSTEPATPAAEPQQVAPSQDQQMSPDQGAAQPQAQPEAPSGEQTTPTPAQGTAENSAASARAKKPSAGKAKKKSKKKSKAKNSTAQTNGEPTRKIVRNGSTRDPELAFVPTLTDAQAERQRKDTERLLGLAENNLKQATLQSMTSSQQGTVDQIRTYMDQSKRAMSAGDVTRAHNLAFKAQLLSNELLPQR